MSDATDKTIEPHETRRLTIAKLDGAAYAIGKLARFGVLVLVAVGVLFFIADFFIHISRFDKTRFLTEPLLITMVWSIAAMLVGGMIAIVCLALWRR
jgi:hypothetical protein